MMLVFKTTNYLKSQLENCESFEGEKRHELFSLELLGCFTKYEYSCLTKHTIQASKSPEEKYPKKGKNPQKLEKKG